MTATETPSTPAVEFVLASKDAEVLECICRNDVMSEGFYAADTSGKWVTPSPEDWDARTIGCLGCGRCIDTHESVMVPNPDPETNDWYQVLVPVTAPEGTLPSDIPDDVL